MEISFVFNLNLSFAFDILLKSSLDGVYEVNQSHFNPSKHYPPDGKRFLLNTKWV